MIITRQSMHTSFKMLFTVLQILSVLSVTDAYSWETNSGTYDQSTNCRVTSPTKRELKCVIKQGIRQLLDLRNEKWGWGARSEAEAILAIYLANDETFSKNDPNTDISAKEMVIVLLDAISKDPNLSSNDWSRGKLSYYTLALTALCQNPNDFYGNKLLDILKGHLTTSANYFQSNKFAYSLSILALCTSNVTLDDSFYQKISETPGTYTFGVDEASLVYQALKCVNDNKYQTETQAALDFILNAQRADGLFGNEYTTALAVQAIFVSKDESLYPKTKAGLKFLAKSIDKKNQPSKALFIFVLPALAKKSYVNVRDTKCKTGSTIDGSSKERDNLTDISVEITVFNNLTTTFAKSWTAFLGSGQSLYVAMDNLRNSDPTFSFTTSETTFGHFITGMCGMPASTDDRQYWQILDGAHVPLDKGVDSTFPQDGDKYIFWLTTW